MEKSANMALTRFEALAREFDFVAEGKTSFGPSLLEFEAKGGAASEAMCFVWYLLDRSEASGQAA